MSIKKNRNKEKVTASGVENVQRLFHTMTPREKLFPHYKSFGKLKTTPCVLGEKTTYKGNNIRNPNREGMKHFISYLRENLGRDRGTIAVITIMNIWNATSFPSEKSCYIESERISFFFLLSLNSRKISMSCDSFNILFLSPQRGWEVLHKFLLLKLCQSIDTDIVWG